MKFPEQARQAAYHSPLGPMTLAATDRHLLGAWFADAAHRPDLGTIPAQADHPILQQAAAELNEYFAGQRTRFELPLRLDTGTSFQNAVWQALLGIEFGRTCSYRFVSEQLGKPRAVRAVAAAIGRNPISIIVPCHRVIGADGSLTGYAGGLPRKIALLQLEGAL
ncbi:MAG: methylated-DNA--[protein]-cysteine S-methyltransferase [Rhodoferax sp.]